MSQALFVAHLTKIFTTNWWAFKRSIYTAVDDISFGLEKGEILGLLGANGAGKTTTIQMLLGTLTPTSGTITYFGSNFEHSRFDVLKKIGYASGYDKLPASLTVKENLDIVGRLHGMSATQRSQQTEQLLKSFAMWNLRDSKTGTLSAGQATRVMLAKAFFADPSIVLLDEPTASLDPDIAQEVRNFILERRETQATSFVITSHKRYDIFL